MNHIHKDNNEWWRFWKELPPEPRKLKTVSTIGYIGTLVLYVIAALCAYTSHNQRSWSEEPKISCQTLTCQKQAASLNKSISDEQINKDDALKREGQLKTARTNPESKLFTQSWDWFDAEIKKAAAVGNAEEHIHIMSIKESFPLSLLLLMGSLSIYFILSRLILLHVKSMKTSFLHCLEAGYLQNWLFPHTCFAILISAGMILSEICTSVLADEKTWFGWDSYCVTPSAFVVKCIAFLAFGVAAAAPFTILWCLGRTDCIPSVQPKSADGMFGGGRYVNFLQAWTLWLILAPSALGIIMIKYVLAMESDPSPVRLLYAAGVALIIAMIVIRFIRNAVILRHRCAEARSSLAISDNDKQQPADPTIAFLGTEWWKLPATITASLVSIWGILEALGMAKFIMMVVNSK